MPSFCAVIGCSNSHKSGKRFFSIPTVRVREGEGTKKLLERRRCLWLKAINRKGLDTKSVTSYHRVCSDHFISGQPAYEQYDTDPDWVPSLNMGHGLKRDIGAVAQKHVRAEGRRKRKQDVAAATSLLELSMSDTQIGESEEPSEAEAPGVGVGEAGNQTELTGREIQVMSDSINNMTCQIVNLKDCLKGTQMNEHKFKNNDKNVKFYTGISEWHVLHSLVLFLSPLLPRNSQNALDPFQEIIITLIKLRLGCPYQLLADMFNISKSSVSCIFQRVLNVMYHNLKFLIYWPERSELEKTMPLDFVRQFKKRVAVIIDCFEIYIERPSNIKARAQTYSTYKSHNTIKYLIGITPQGSICFLSEGWGGRVSDKHITLNSGFLDKLDLGDIVLADRGFDIHDSVTLMCAELKIPAFTKGRKQLPGLVIENTRKLAHLRIHIERVIGNMQNKYSILNGTIPVDYLISAQTDITTLDQIVTVCACLTNLCPSVVPFT